MEDLPLVNIPLLLNVSADGLQNRSLYVLGPRPHQSFENGIKGYFLGNVIHLLDAEHFILAPFDVGIKEGFKHQR
uniref:Uncharacterized protein n=1 Tax=Anguilla anguilla TaxID=7936 RepID=A0A0E9QFJ3_ANGAN